MQRLLDRGELYFNHPRLYNEWQAQEPQSGDIFEGADWVENAYVKKIQFLHPTLGTGELIPDPRELSKQIQYNYDFLSYSMYALTTDEFVGKDTFSIDPGNADLKDADSAVFIQEPYLFLKAVTAEIKSRNLRYRAKHVQYKDISTEGLTKMNPFIKKKEHQHQNEFRIILENMDDKPQAISIGSIATYSYLVSAKSMIETVWKVPGK